MIPDADSGGAEEGGDGRGPGRRLGPYGWVCLAAAAGSVGYRVLVLGQKEQSALMFIGLPTAMAIGISMLPRAASATGMIMRGMTLFLLLLGILLIEGAICILMAAPLFYAVGLVVGVCLDRARAKGRGETKLRMVAVPLLAVMSLEGAVGWLSFPREERVAVSCEVPDPPAEVRERLARGPTFDLSELPVFLTLGFPKPRRIEGGGLERGDRWTIHFAGGEGKPGDLVAEVVASGADRIRVVRVRDTSHIAHWLDWQEAIWTIEPSAAGSRVTLEMSYRRLLDPAWYFKPIERYGVRRAGEYFLGETFKRP